MRNADWDCPPLELLLLHHAGCRRLEALVSGGDTFSCDTGAHKHHGSDRGSKQLLLQLQASVQALEHQHAASSGSNRSMADQLHKVEQRVQQLEAQGSVLQQQLGTPAPTHRAGSAHGQHRLTSGPITSIMQAGVCSTAADDVAAVHVMQHAGLPGGRSMAARLSKLEQQVEALTGAAASTEVKPTAQGFTPMQMPCACRSSFHQAHACPHACAACSLA